MNIKNVLILLLFTVCNLSFAQETEEKINQFDENGNRHGLWKGVYEKSKRPRYEGTFIHGKETGVFKYFDDTKAGTVIATRDFSQGDGGAYVTFYDQKGHKVSEGYVNKDKQNHGEWKYYHQSSPQLMAVEHYNNGKLHGKSLVFYKDGKIASETYYVDGVKEGIYKKYAENGVVLEEIPYKNNQFYGLVTYRYTDGSIYTQGMYEKGLKKGIWRYYENGKLVKEVDTETNTVTKYE